MESKIVKTTSKGQITLPKNWRNQFDTKDFLIKVESSQIVIKPVRIDVLEANEEVIFDADRDNKGRGVSPDEMIKMLKKIRNEHNRKISKKAKK